MMKPLAIPHASISALARFSWFVVVLSLPGTPGTAAAIPFTVTMNEPVTVSVAGGTPQIAIDVGGVQKFATYRSGSGTSTLTFAYQVQPSDFDADGSANANASSVSFKISKLPTVPADAYTYSYTISSANGGSVGAADVIYSASSVTVSNIDLSGLAMDGLTTSAQAAYVTRLLRSAYQGPLLRVRRSSDNQEMDIGPGLGGGLAAAMLTSFCGSGSCSVSRWHDQSGNGRDAVQATSSAQPRLVNAGTLLRLNGRPVLEFTGSSSMFLSIVSSPLAGLASAYINVTGAIYSEEAWSRVFDFGSGTSAYMFVPVGSNGRFRITTNSWSTEQGPIPAAIPT